MTRTALSTHGCGTGIVSLHLLAWLLAMPATGHAQIPPPPPTTPQPDLDRTPLVPSSATNASSASPNTPTSRIRLFRFQPGFLSDPVGLETDERLLGEADGGPDFFTIAIGNDNPFFDFRQRGDPGGVGYARVNTQVQLLDTDRTAFALVVQAVTPAGLEFDGLPDRMGATVLTPALSLFHALDDGTAVQAFVGKHMPIQNGATQSAKRDVQYGMAIQRPLWADDEVLKNLVVSVGALGQQRLETRTPITWEVLPGLHYKMAENWWISGGLSVPVGKAEAVQQWQVTCSMQF